MPMYQIRYMGIFSYEQGLGKATPQQDSAQDKIELRAKFGPAVESCSKNLSEHLIFYHHLLFPHPHSNIVPLIGSTLFEESDRTLVI